MARTHTRARTS